MAVDDGWDLVRDGVRLGSVRRSDEPPGWVGYVEHRGLVVEVGVWANQKLSSRFVTM